MAKVSRVLSGVCTRGTAGLLVLLSTVSPGRAQVSPEVPADGPLTKLLSGGLGAVDTVVILIACVATAMIASFEFARKKVTVFDVPTMPKYTVAPLTYRYFNALYVAIVLFLFIVVMEKYETLRVLLVEQGEIFGKLPAGDNVVAIALGSVILVTILHYAPWSDSHIGPSWFLHKLRCALHKRARIPEAAQALANQIMSDDATIFAVPKGRIPEVIKQEQVRFVSEADFEAASNTIDYQWAVISYLYTVGIEREVEPPYSSFASNDASLWPQIKAEYVELAPFVDLLKAGRADAPQEEGIRAKLAELRRDLSIFLACLHLFGVGNDPERIERLKALGLKQSGVFFIITRSRIAKILIVVTLGIALPPLFVGILARATGSAALSEFANPELIRTWVFFGAPMYFPPIAMVMLLKRFMGTSWPIRAALTPAGADATGNQRTEFKYDVYLLIFVASFAIASMPLYVYEAMYTAPVSKYWALGPAATAVCLAVLIDLDVVYPGKPSRNPMLDRRTLIAIRAICFAVLLGGIVSWLTATLTDATGAQHAVYAATAAFIGLMIGSQSDFHRDVRKV